MGQSTSKEYRGALVTDFWNAEYGRRAVRFQRERLRFVIYQDGASEATLYEFISLYKAKANKITMNETKKEIIKHYLRYFYD